MRTVYDLTSAKLFGICLRISHDREGAEDILQDVYVKVWRHAASYDAAKASPVTWLAMIAHNAAIDWMRVEHRHLGVVSDEIAEVTDMSPLADSEIENAEGYRRLQACLDALEPRQSGAIRNAFFNGQTYQQLADRDGTPIGTIKSWIRRGLLQLKACLGDG